jgi:Polysaccharide lyase
LLLISGICLWLQTGTAHVEGAEPEGPVTPISSKQCRAASAGRRELYGLPPPASLSDGVSFVTDWDQVRTGGWYGQQSVDSCRIRPDGFLTWHGKAAVRVEVQPHDDPLGANANSERAEMLMMQDANGRAIEESKHSGVQFYATSYYFPATWHGEQLPWSAFGSKDCSADQNRCNSWSFVWQFYPWGGLSAAQRVANGPQLYVFNNSYFANNGSITPGKWTDFVFMVDWNEGAYTIWRRDEGQRTFTQVLNGITPMRLGRNIYVKQGLYRGGNVDDRTDVLWIGPTARDSTFAAVERQAFGTDDGPA